MNNISASRHRTYKSGGFSLIEMAVVLMILGTLLSGVLVAVGETVENSRRTNARDQLRQVAEALYGFAQANGRLPCPAIVAAPGNNPGKESPVGGGTCTVAHGFVPSATLGIYGNVNTDGLLLDPWQNPLRYSVSTFKKGPHPAFTSIAGMQALFAGSSPTAHPSLIKVCNTAACDDVILSDTVPVLVFSMGENWPVYNSTIERTNAGNGSTRLGSYNIHAGSNNNFVSAGYVEDVFDDQLIWLSSPVLFNRLITAGKLP